MAWHFSTKTPTSSSSWTLPLIAYTLSRESLSTTTVWPLISEVHRRVSRMPTNLASRTSTLPANLSVRPCMYDPWWFRKIIPAENDSAPLKTQASTFIFNVPASGANHLLVYLFSCSWSRVAVGAFLLRACLRSEICLKFHVIAISPSHWFFLPYLFVSCPPHSLDDCSYFD